MDSISVRAIAPTKTAAAASRATNKQYEERMQNIKEELQNTQHIQDRMEMHYKEELISCGCPPAVSWVNCVCKTYRAQELDWPC